MPVFVDTNVLVYARDLGEPVKGPKAQAWLEHLWRSRQGRLSYQVLSEYYVTVTQKLDPGFDRTAARADIRNLLAWHPVLIDEGVVEAAWQLQDHHSLSLWDALILAAAGAANCDRVLSEDLTDGETYGAVTVVNPFLHEIC
ncbi:MAG TPA: PIN domain-containing protein [Acidimicrobiia bacterium]|nr:PIN domain-containing protein [Acidimicrobiia bacterium]